MNSLNLGQVHQQAQVGRTNQFAEDRAEIAAERQDQQFDEEQQLKNTYRLYGGLKVVDELFSAGKNDEAYMAAEEISKNLIETGIIDPERWDPSLVTPESTKEGLTKLEAVIAGRPRPGAVGASSRVGKTWINPDTQTMWAIDRQSGQAFDTGVPAQQYALRPVETSEGLAMVDPARQPQGGQQVGQVVPGTDPESMRQREAADVASQEEVKRVANLRKTAPAAHKSVSYALTTMDRFIDQAKKLRAHPGLKMATGFGGEELSGVDGTPAADAAAMANTLKSQSFITALGSMREASKTGGAVGNVSDAEGGRFENAFVSLMQSQSYPQYVSELNRLISIAEESKTLLGDAYNNEYKGIDGAPTLELRPAEDEEAILEMARDAIARGKDQIAVKRMLQDVYGIDPARL